MSCRESYLEKRMGPEEAIGHLRDGDFVIIPTAAGEPPELLTTLGERRRGFRDVKVAQILMLGKYGFLDPETCEHVRPVAFFFSGATRTGGAEGWIDFIPSNFSELPSLIERSLIPSDTVMSLASPMDGNGNFAISLGVDYTKAALAKARTVLLEVNPNVPFAHGDCTVHISQVTALIESERPLVEVGMPKMGPVHEAIGHHVAELIEDGDTLQIGYGGIPDAVVMQLKDKRDLGIHTELIGDGILSLVECGAVTNRRKTYLPGRMVATFALGSRKLYRFLDRNPMIEMHPVSFTNDPYLAGQNDNLVAVNGTLEIDFLGQCGSESIGHKPYSGTGGQSDFVRAANRSRGGRSIIVLPSTAKNDTISRIVPSLGPGTHVTTGKNDVNYVVSEYGVAQLRGKSAKQRAAELVAIAHPDFRAELRDAARQLNLL